MLNNIFLTFSKIITEGGVWAPIVALLAGLVTSVLPCSLSSIPLIIGYVKGSGQVDSKKSFKLSLVFALGMSLTFITIGIVTGFLGRLVVNISGLWYIIFGIFLLLMAIQIWGIYYFIKPGKLINKSKSKGYLGAMVSGVLAGLFSSPCSTPIMLTLVSVLIVSKANIFWSILLFLMYAIGHSIITVLVGSFTVAADRFMASKGYKNLAKGLEIILGGLVMALGIYFIYLGI